MMKKYNYNLGGEQSGHIILGKFATTGDDLLVALEVLFALASWLVKRLRYINQCLKTFKYKGKR